MSSNVSLTNPGTSLNFDGQALQIQQEAELDREDQLQQNELRQLLSSAFDELEDDILSVASSEDDSVNTSHLSSHQHSLSEGHVGREGSGLAAGTETLGGQTVPVRDWPPDTPWSVQDRVPWTTGVHTAVTDHDSLDTWPKHHPADSAYRQAGQASGHLTSSDAGPVFSDSQAGLKPILSWSGGGVVYSERRDLTVSSQSDSVPRQFSQRPQPVTDAGDWTNPHQFTSDDVYQDFLPLPTSQSEKVSAQTMMARGEAVFPVGDGALPDRQTVVSQGGNTGGVVSRHCPQSYPTISNGAHWGSAQGDEDDYSDYTVQYRPLQRSSDPHTQHNHLQHNFINQDTGDEDSTQQTQLRLLYESRGRQLEDLKVELDQMTQDAAKERRMLKHLLAVTQSEKEGMEGSWKQSQRLLQEVQDTESETSSQLQAAQQQITALTAANSQLQKKMSSAETTIESLTHQLSSLQAGDSLSQARQQHEAVVSSMQQRHEAETLHLKQQLDQARESTNNLEKEVERLKSQVRQQTLAADQAHLARGETINQLTHKLDQSQHRCQALLDAASSEESSKLRSQLQQALVSKKMAEDMCTSLKCEVQDLQEQVGMLETATSLGAWSGSAPPSAVTEDSITDLGIRKTLDFSTPQSQPSARSGGQSLEELVHKLRVELERCVASNKDKRSKLAALEQDRRDSKQHTEQLQQQLDTAQRTIKTQQVKLEAYEERVGDSLQPSAVESGLKRDIDRLNMHKQVLEKDVQEYYRRLEEVSGSEERLMDINSSLKSQISHLVTQHDADMKQAVDRCRKTCEDAHKTAKEKLEHDLRSQHFADKQELILNYDTQLQKLRSQLQDQQEELDRVKELYVQTCEDLRQQEEALSQAQHSTTTLTAERHKWEKEQEDRWVQRVEEEKSKWQSEHAGDVDGRLAQRLECERERWEAEHQAVWDSQRAAVLAQERQRVESDMESRWATRLDRETLSWQVTADKNAVEQVDMAVEAAKRQWQEETQRQLTELTRQLENCRTQHQAQLVAMETEWRQEVERKEAELQRHLQATLGEEVSAKLEQQRQQLEKQHQDLLHKEVEAASQRHHTQLEERVKEERERVMKEAEVARQEALDTALKHCQQQHAQEVSEYRGQCQRVQAELKRQQEAWQDERTKLMGDKDEERRQAMAAVRGECQADLDRLMADNKATLDTALESARQHHHQQLQEMERQHKEQLSAVQCVEKGQSEGDQASLQRQCQHLRSQVAKRDELLQQADSHMERELERLKESLAEAYGRQREKDTLRMQAQYSHALATAHKERTRLERQLELLQRRESGEQERADQHRLLEAHAAAKDLERTLQDVQKERDRLLARLEDCNTAIRSLQRDKETMQRDKEAMQQQLAALQKHLEATRQHSQQAEAALRAVNQQHKLDVDRLQSQHRADITALQQHIAQMKKQHKVMLEEVESEHEDQQRALAAKLETQHVADTHAMMEELQRQTHRALTHTPTQTESEDSLCSLKDQYFHTMQKIKEEVMLHISRSNERAAMAIKTEIRQERQRTIHHLRHRIKVRLSQMSSRCGGSVVLAAVEQTVDAVCDSAGSSRSATPSRATPLTPRSDDTEPGPDTRKPQVTHDVSTNSAVASNTSSDRYDLPVTLRHVQPEAEAWGDSNPQTSGLYYSLQVDDAASVTDSELEVAQRKSGSRRVAFHASSSSRPCTPPTVKSSGLSVFVGERGGQSGRSFLSPKLRNDHCPPKRSPAPTEGSVWKEVDGGGWTAAVGGSNLWTALSNLTDMDTQGTEPRRQLCFASRSLLDTSAGTHRSDTSASSHHRRAESAVSRSVDVARLRQGKEKEKQKQTFRSKLLAEKDADDGGTEGESYSSDSTNQSAHYASPQPRHTSSAPHNRQPLNPKHFLSKSGSRGVETLDSMLARLGVRGSDLNHGTTGKQAQDLSDTLPSTVSQDSRPSQDGRGSSQPRSYSAHRQPPAGRIKSRTHSADAALSLTAPSLATPSPSLSTPLVKGGRVRRDGQLVQRSLEDVLEGDQQSVGLRHSKVKFKSEQGLHLLHKAADWDYTYSPLQQMLPPPSLSTSLLSSYSASEGDLRAGSPHLAWNSQLF